MKRKKNDHGYRAIFYSTVKGAYGQWKLCHLKNILESNG